MADNFGWWLIHLHVALFESLHTRGARRQNFQIQLEEGIDGEEPVEGEVEEEEEDGSEIEGMRSGLVVEENLNIKVVGEGIDAGQEEDEKRVEGRRLKKKKKKTNPKQ